MELLSDEGRLEPWEPADADRLPPEALFDDWTSARTNRYVLGWNTERVSDGERPRSWDDLADPRWRGKLVMEVSDVDFARTLIEHWVSEGDSFEEAEDRFEAIAGNARFVDGHTLQAELLASGEFDAGAAVYAYQVDEAADEGAAVAWQPAVSPTVTRPNGPGIVKDAPHPAAAALFVDWFTGPGQDELRRLGLEPARGGLADAKGVDSVPIDIDEFLAEQEEWQERYDGLVALGGEGPSE
jgi:iron(III) transport system substrate-binding protein